MKIENVKFGLSIAFFAVLVLSVIGYLMYEYITKSNSEVRYTVCTMVDNYSSSKDIGKKYEYTANGELFENICTSHACAEAKLGSKYVLKYWVDDPKLTEIYFDSPITTDIVVPKDGWKEHPYSKK